MSAPKYLHNRVATSNGLLLVAIVLALLLWLPLGLTDVKKMIGFAVCIVCTALILELNNANVLLRVRSRMVSATFIFVWASCTFLQPFQWAHVATVCLILAYHSLFKAYQQTQTSIEVFNAFLCIGISTLAAPQLVLLAIPLAWAFVWFQAMNARSFFAMLLGLAAPVWIGGSYAYLTDSLPALWEHFNLGWAWTPSYYLQLTIPQIAIAVILLVLDLIAIVHCFRFSFQDKIRTRLLFYFMAWMTVVLVALLVAFPLHFNTMLALFIVNSSPLIAHYVALAEGKAPRALFLGAVFLLALLGTLHLWMPLVHIPVLNNWF